MNPEEEHRSIQLIRGQIITNFAYIELMMSELIAFHYTESRQKNDEVIQDILEDEYFQFGLRKNIFKKVMEKYYKDKNFPFGDLTNLGRYRNIIGHATIKNDEITQGDEHILQRSPYYWHNGEKKDCAELNKKYFDLSDNIMQILKKLTLSETIEFSKVKRKDDQ